MSSIKILFTDIETTGLKQEDGHRIIEVACGLWEYEPGTNVRRKIGKTWVQRINPMREIDAGAYAVHGISLADLRGQPKWEEVAKKVHKLLAFSDIAVAHNGLGFDMPFIAMELIRIGMKVPSIKVFDTMLEGRQCTAFGKVPNLGELCWANGVDYDPESAHSAAYDVEVMEQSYWNGIENGLFKAPGDFLATL